jgi:hypothetical protein
VFAEDDQIVTCGVNHIFFWLKEDKGEGPQRKPHLSSSTCGLLASASAQDTYRLDFRCHSFWPTSHLCPARSCSQPAGYLKKRGIFGTRGKLQSIVCLAVSGNRVISGTVGGFLYLWVGRNCAKAVKGHMVSHSVR